ncbi:hypothetical protein ASAP_0204 [Asaia bogorensis]|uniref:Uncharacterized protein n=1 Tax=Asaia bogorensis TaxID=91915 RepID=A0A060QAX2_9PROT|nr:hypothetical protein P792_07445 [Asaia sp. SF2.1]CDG38249.1 hypothetical protein ASAP_0204 [Asaia bogorensis]
MSAPLVEPTVKLFGCATLPLNPTTAWSNMATTPSGDVIHLSYSSERYVSRRNVTSSYDRDRMKT